VSTREFVHSILISAPPDKVLEAFFDPRALAAWWTVTRSQCLPQPLREYAVAWETTTWSDDILGRLGGALQGTLIEFNPNHELFVADLYWFPPDGAPLGPMALEVTCGVQPEGTLLSVRQSGCDANNQRWMRYYDIIPSGWVESLGRLKKLLEGEQSPSAREHAR